MSFDSILDLFSSVFNRHAPIIRKRVKFAQQRERMNDDIKEGMRNRDYYNGKSDVAENKYWRNMVKYMIEDAKQEYYFKI